MNLDFKSYVSPNHSLVKQLSIYLSIIVTKAILIHPCLNLFLLPISTEKHV